MESEKPSGPIAWDDVSHQLPGTAQDLLQEVRTACEQHPDDPARAIQLALRSRIAELRGRFERATGGAS